MRPLFLAIALATLGSVPAATAETGAPPPPPAALAEAEPARPPISADAVCQVPATLLEIATRPLPGVAPRFADTGPGPGPAAPPQPIPEPARWRLDERRQPATVGRDLASDDRDRSLVVRLQLRF